MISESNSEKNLIKKNMTKEKKKVQKNSKKFLFFLKKKTKNLKNTLESQEIKGNFIS